MEPFHFYKNETPNQHKKLAQWIGVHCILFAAAIMSMASLHFKQWYTHSCVISEKNIINIEHQKLSHVHKYQQNEKQLDERLSKKTQHIKQQRENQKLPLEPLKIIKNSLKKEINLETCSLKENIIELKLGAEKTNILLECAKKLCHNTNFSELRITSLSQKEKNHFCATLTGKYRSRI